MTITRRKKSPFLSNTFPTQSKWNFLKAEKSFDMDLAKERRKNPAILPTI